MNRMWERIMLPIIEFGNIQSIVEIGAEKGINTKNILKYCVDNNAKLFSIDPAPLFDVEAFEKEYEGHFTLFKDLSLEVLPFLEDYDCVLVDGDHNWYTVYHELTCISKKFSQDNFPLIFLHDVSWPYGRRDLYYNPEVIPLEYLNDYSKLGMHPDSEELLPKYGLNANLFNANKENTPRNGVLTAVEDFIKDCHFDLEFHFVPIFFGLGIIHRKDDTLKEFIKKVIYNSDILYLVESFYIKNDIFKNRVINEKNKLNQDLINAGAEKDIKIKFLSQKIDKIENNSSEITNKLQEKSFRLSELQKKNVDLINEKNSKQDHISDLKKEINKIGEEIEIKNDVLASLNQNNLQLTKINDNQLIEINDLKNEISSLNRTIDINIEKNKILNEFSDKQQVEIEDLKTKLLEANNKLADCEGELSKNKHELAQYSTRIVSLKELNDSLIELKNMQSDEIARLRNDNSNSKKLIDDLLIEKATLEGVADTQKDEINELSEDLFFSNRKLSEYSDKLYDYKVKFSEKAYDFNHVNIKSQRLAYKNEILTDKNYSQSQEIIMLNDDLIVSNNKIIDLENKIDELTEIIRNKEKEFDELTKAYQNTVHVKYSLEQENSYLKNSRNLNKLK